MKTKKPRYFEDVGEFHLKFGLDVTPEKGGAPEDWNPPELIEDSAAEFRGKFLLEEVSEFLAAKESKDIVGIADALVDLVYVALGTAHLYRIPFNEIWKEVHSANLKKERAIGKSDPRGRRNHPLDVVKPEGWVHPDVEGVLFEWEADRDECFFEESCEEKLFCQKCRQPIHWSNNTGYCHSCYKPKSRTRPPKKLDTSQSASIYHLKTEDPRNDTDNQRNTRKTETLSIPRHGFSESVRPGIPWGMSVVLCGWQIQSEF